MTKNSNPIGDILKALYNTSVQEVNLLGKIAQSNEDIKDKLNEKGSNGFFTNLGADLVGFGISQSLWNPQQSRQLSSSNSLPNRGYSGLQGQLSNLTDRYSGLVYTPPMEGSDPTVYDVHQGRNAKTGRFMTNFIFPSPSVDVIPEVSEKLKPSGTINFERAAAKMKRKAQEFWQEDSGQININRILELGRKLWSDDSGTELMSGDEANSAGNRLKSKFRRKKPLITPPPEVRDDDIVSRERADSILGKSTKERGVDIAGLASLSIAKKAGIAFAIAEAGLSVAAGGEGGVYGNFEGYKKMITSGTSEYGGIKSWAIFGGMPVAATVGLGAPGFFGMLALGGILKGVS